MLRTLNSKSLRKIRHRLEDGLIQARAELKDVKLVVEDNKQIQKGIENRIWMAEKSIVELDKILLELKGKPDSGVLAA